MATKIAIAQKRMFENVFVCKNCNKKVRSEPFKIAAGKIRCQKCHGRAFRPIRRKK